MTLPNDGPLGPHTPPNSVNSANQTDQSKAGSGAGGQAGGETRRFQDAIDAHTWGAEWVHAVADRDDGPSRLIRRLPFENEDGGVILYTRADQERALAVMIRDVANYTVTVRILPQPGEQDEPSTAANSAEFSPQNLPTPGSGVGVSLEAVKEGGRLAEEGIRDFLVAFYDRRGLDWKNHGIPDLVEREFKPLHEALEALTPGVGVSSGGVALERVAGDLVEPFASHRALKGASTTDRMTFGLELYRAVLSTLQSNQTSGVGGGE